MVVLEHGFEFDLGVSLGHFLEALVLYLKRPRAESWKLKRCEGALQIQRLEGSRPGGTMGFVCGWAGVDRLRVCRCDQSAWVSIVGRREKGRGAAHGRV